MCVIYYFVIDVFYMFSLSYLCLFLNVFFIVLKHILSPSFRIFGLFLNLCSFFGCTGRKVR